MGASPPVICVAVGRAEVVMGDGVSLFPPQATKAAITASAGKTIEACLIPVPPSRPAGARQGVKRPWVTPVGASKLHVSSSDSESPPQARKKKLSRTTASPAIVRSFIPHAPLVRAPRMESHHPAVTKSGPVRNHHTTNQLPCKDLCHTGASPSQSLPVQEYGFYVSLGAGAPHSAKCRLAGGLPKVHGSGYTMMVCQSIPRRRFSPFEDRGV